ncbi:hypothetical protein HMPREF0080_01342 [Anaeroglobus geminatus F0357]|uniref:Uncharacterized protein n=1 Tax=Anaeroglobus geminatus F0357 TaxID=861450 RepID=G9YI57_9FIRM|nr:hypothetical protein HMPREF0080_01342 [Anaeroglobus geminatus F0357]
MPRRRYNDISAGIDFCPGITDKGSPIIDKPVLLVYYVREL